MALRLLIACLLAVTFTGCATTKARTAHPRKEASYASSPMIIHQEDIEPSIGTFPKPVISTRFAQGSARHTVRTGETLWSISKLYGVDVAELANANSISDSKSIEVGKILTIPGTSSGTIGKKVNYSARRSATFIWPVRGNIAASFGSRVDKYINKGIDIKASEGMNVAASRGGKVVYCDSHLKGFGRTVIIDHMDGFQTVYSYNAGIMVKVGDMVEQRDVIAKVGSSGRAREPMLHFEIRKNGEPQNPEFYLSR
ncbi:MAG: LysM peptidoglycan-binding domain-containing M23 family metallopeptidase [Candidatus Omnitrophica bacterium]|nr:LysM peptidoglycan-binding domain-containing M23 family metallopeptidase [Candidatus Omnitrophota bacterium]